MPSSLLISPFAFVDSADVIAYVTKGITPSDPQADAIVRGINWGAATMENITGRRLRARNYTFPRSRTVTASGSTLTGDMSGVRVGDPVVATGFTFPAYTLVTAVASGSCAVTATGLTGAGTATFGSQPLIMDGDGLRSAILDEKPLQALWAVWCTYGLNILNPVDISNASIEPEISKVTLRNDFFYSGVANVQIEARLGYDQPSGSSLGNPGDWDALSACNLRLAQVYWQEWMTPTGRFESSSAGGASAAAAKQILPPDLMASIMAYARRGA